MENLQNLSEEQITSDLLPQKFGRRGMIWTAGLIVICCIGAFAYIKQLREGLIVTNMGDYVSWGIYISNFVFFVAVSLVGSLITAIFRLSGVPWRTPLTRIAEIIAVSNITFAALIIIVDMSRPDRIYFLFTHGRIQSPILWDVIVITTYFFLSLLLLYITLIPDARVMIGLKDKLGKPFSKLYRWMASFWKGTAAQEKIRDRGITILCITIVPVAFCIHTVTSWLFATTYRPGWDSSNFGAYFVSGAFLVGAGAVVVAMYVFRRVYKLENYITQLHFDKMGKITVMLALLYLYFNVNEFLVPAFKMKKEETDYLNGLFTGDYSIMFWFAILVGMIIPIMVLIFKKGRTPRPMFIVGVMIVVGAWFKRYLIVTPTLLHPFLPKYDAPARFSHYFPSWEEWAITIGSMAGVLLIITFFVRVFPIISIYKTLEDKNEITKLAEKLEQYENVQTS
ncbi:MAG TPA: NrfD/PsrC family molybdoenzyme membrane anchor subunit [Flavipsychrobacter sp.]|nr:NrfD/PsrC family molybdoenzyme membrane anchor subunit [Flavipsychrobacter sp.]